tara:strand:+ start:277 stop:606 length:330 start_codon:yes stop_codon:yes gene_type:complete
MDKITSTMSETTFLNWVMDLANQATWLVYHTHDSRRSQPGFPDLTMAKGGRLIFAELKSEKGRVSPHQQVWLNQLEKIKGVEVYLWRPSHIDEIVDKLMGHQNGSPLAK